MGNVRRDMEFVRSGDRSVLAEYETFACPVPSAE
jgi:hypothetical protein